MPYLQTTKGLRDVLSKYLKKGLPGAVRLRWKFAFKLLTLCKLCLDEDGYERCRRLVKDFVNGSIDLDKLLRELEKLGGGGEVVAGLTWTDLLMINSKFMSGGSPPHKKHVIRI